MKNTDFRLAVHELRNAVSAMVMASRMLQTRLSAEQRSEHGRILERMPSASNRAVTILESLETGERDVHDHEQPPSPELPSPIAAPITSCWGEDDVAPTGSRCGESTAASSYMRRKETTGEPHSRRFGAFFAGPTVASQLQVAG